MIILRSTIVIVHSPLGVDPFLYDPLCRQPYTNSGLILNFGSIPLFPNPITWSRLEIQRPNRL
jgi:hypothetical protein